MWLTFALIILSTSVVVFFSQEFAGLFKKWFEIPGMSLLIPLLLASLLVEFFEHWAVWCFEHLKDGLHGLLHQTASYLPWGQASVPYLHALLLLVFGVMPVWVLLAWRRIKKRPAPWPYAYWTGFILWLSAAILLTVYRP